MKHPFEGSSQSHAFFKIDIQSGFLNFTNNAKDTLFLFVCLLLFGVYRPNSMIIALVWRRHQYRWRSANSPWPCPLSSEGSLACHTFCDTGHPFIMVISVDPCHSNHKSLPVIETKVCRSWDSNTKPSACEANALTHCATPDVVNGFYLFTLFYHIIIPQKSFSYIKLLSINELFINELLTGS